MLNIKSLIVVVLLVSACFPNRYIIRDTSKIEQRRESISNTDNTLYVEFVYNGRLKYKITSIGGTVEIVITKRESRVFSLKRFRSPLASEIKGVVGDMNSSQAEFANIINSIINN